MSKSVYIREKNTVGTLFPENVSVRFCGRTLGYNDVIIGGSFVTLTVKLFGGKDGYGQLLKDFGKETQLSRNKKSMRDLSGTIAIFHWIGSTLVRVFGSSLVSVVWDVGVRRCALTEAK